MIWTLGVDSWKFIKLYTLPQASHIDSRRGRSASRRSEAGSPESLRRAGKLL